MSAPFDPYAELKVPRNAPAAAVRKAFRAKAQKVHPDKGGNAEAFGRARRAMLVLTDPARREKFDRTGAVDDEQPDNARAAALQIIAKHAGTVVNRYLQSGLNPLADHRRVDLVATARAGIEGEIAKAKASVAAGEPVVAVLRDTAARFETKEAVNALAAVFNAQADENQRKVEQLRQVVVFHELALEILAKYRFRSDPFTMIIPGVFTQTGGT